LFAKVPCNTCSSKNVLVTMFYIFKFLKFIEERNLNVFCVAMEIISTKAYIMDVGKIG
jgi:hypothetical protein